MSALQEPVHERVTGTCAKSLFGSKQTRLAHQPYNGTLGIRRKEVIQEIMTMNSIYEHICGIIAQ